MYTDDSVVIATAEVYEDPEDTEESEDEDERRWRGIQEEFDTDDATDITEEEEEEVEEEMVMEEMISKLPKPQVTEPIQELTEREEESELTSTTEEETEEEEEESEEESEDGWLKNATDRIFGTILQISHHGMVQLVMIIVVTLYTVFGALLFVMVERDRDLQRRQLAMQYIYKMIDELWETAQDDAADYKIWELQLQKRMTNPEYMEELCDANLWEDALLERRSNSLWTMENSVYYCFTVFTSIGYGNIVPRTDIGRILTIMYGVIGIPLMVVALADFGNRLQRMLERMCVMTFQFYYVGKLGSLKIKPPILVVWEFSYFVEQCTITYGSCPLPRKQFEKKLRERVNYYKNNIREYEEFKIPSVAALMIFLAVVLLFSHYFSHTEKLNFFDSFYFVFITLTLIGFGDIVPQEMNLYVFNIFVILLLASLSFFYSVVGDDLTAKIISLRNRFNKIFVDPKARILPAIREQPVPLGQIHRGPWLLQLLARSGPEIKKPGYFVPGTGIPQPRYRKPNKSIWQKLI